MAASRQLWAASNIDVVSFDNYLPLSDWTTGDGRGRRDSQLAARRADRRVAAAPSACPDSAFPACRRSIRQLT